MNGEPSTWLPMRTSRRNTIFHLPMRRFSVRVDFSWISRCVWQRFLSNMNWSMVSKRCSRIVRGPTLDSLYHSVRFPLRAWHRAVKCHSIIHMANWSTSGAAPPLYASNGKARWTEQHGRQERSLCDFQFPASIRTFWRFQKKRRLEISFEFVLPFPPMKQLHLKLEYITWDNYYYARTLFHGQNFLKNYFPWSTQSRRWTVNQIFRLADSRSLSATRNHRFNFVFDSENMTPARDSHQPIRADNLLFVVFL